MIRFNVEEKLINSWTILIKQSTVKNMAELFKKLRNFDAYPKTLDDFRVKTYGGAAGNQLILFCLHLD